MVLYFYFLLFIITLGSFYLSLTVSHIYLYFGLIVTTSFLFKNYVYSFYAVYINFYWIFFFYQFFYFYNFIYLHYLFHFLNQLINIFYL